MRTIKPGSHLLKHVLDKHEGETLEEVDFRMRVVKYHKSPFERQVHESVLIQASTKHHLLNSKSEFNRCQIPIIAIKMREKEIKEKKEELERDIVNETERELELEGKIKALRKLINKKRAPRRPQQCEPGRKRLRIDPDGQIEQEIRGMRERQDALERDNVTERKKDQSDRKENLENLVNQTNKKHKQCGSDIRIYLSKSKVLESTDLQPPLPPPNILQESFSARVPARGEEGGGDSSQSPPLNEMSKDGKINKSTIMDTPRSQIPPQTKSTIVDPPPRSQVTEQIEIPRSKLPPQITMPPQDQIPPQSTNLQLSKSMSAKAPVGEEEGVGDSSMSPPPNEFAVEENENEPKIVRNQVQGEREMEIFEEIKSAKMSDGGEGGGRLKHEPHPQRGLHC